MNIETFIEWAHSLPTWRLEYYSYFDWRPIMLETKTRESKIYGSAFDVILILHNTVTNTYHPAFFAEAPMPGGEARPVEDVIRLRSKMHHTEGAPTLEGAQAIFDELVQDIFVPEENRWRTDVVEWNGELGITLLCRNWKTR